MTRFRKGLTVVLLFWAAAARAQVTVQVEVNQQQYIPREPITVAVRIVNRSGLTLHLGARQDWLSFDVEAVNGGFVPRMGEAPVVREFDLPNTARGTRWVNIAPYFDLRKVGRYKVIATVRIPQLNQDLVSPPAYFNLISGATIWEQPFGWQPVIDGRAREVQFRRYALVNAMNGKRVMLYARLADRDNFNVIRVRRLGRLLNFSRPAARIDPQSRLHVLWQTGARVFTYCVLGPQLELILRRTHQYTGTRPSLRVLPDGQIKVVGGSRIPNASDFPPPKETEETEAPAAAPKLPTPPPLDAEPSALRPTKPASAPKTPPPAVPEK